MSVFQDRWHKGGATCKIDGTITQVVGAPTPAGLNIIIPTGTEAELLSILLSVGAVGTARVVNVSHVTSADAEVFQFIAVTLDDNNTFRGPIQYVITDDQVANTANASAGLSYVPYMISGGEKIRIVILSAANAEVLTIKTRLRIRGRIPNIAAIGAAISIASFTPTVI